jgi:hypothetical protein
VQPHTTDARSSNCGTLKIEKMNRRRGVLIKLIMFPSITRRRWLCEERRTGFAFLMVIKMETLIPAFKIKPAGPVLSETFRLIVDNVRHSFDPPCRKWVMIGARIFL